MSFCLLKSHWRTNEEEEFVNIIQQDGLLFRTTANIDQYPHSEIFIEVPCLNRVTCYHDNENVILHSVTMLNEALPR